MKKEEKKNVPIVPSALHVLRGAFQFVMQALQKHHTHLITLEKGKIVCFCYEVEKKITLSSENHSFLEAKM